MDIEYKKEKEWVIEYDKKISYSIIRSKQIFDPKNKTLLLGGNRNGSKRFVVVDNFIYESYKQEITEYFVKNQIEAKIVPFQSGEKNKNSQSFFTLIKALDNFQINRRSEPIIAI